ncbi:MAG: hypothetical protein COW32_00165 [Candidatus Aquicultor secundus]|uniref:Uncharacterized protein n=1 Tax=Candidatus Aquicultor secundus TaxID=1973895 RepID=A0A2M7TAP5_9ACTN|nr:hypothetical protein [Candidatus Aquicultor secundus]NCO66460.1 hypothetical protein [Solirubrobacter sp.]OIO85319.1 MAG: hypothetical protein AUK32_07465 [Candidatus Aquicultor secundus]PIU26826.1 MAG: hypothetical protein COT10_06640 [Candidatus Aquicultor secundus]PIW23271.1 MAG: hypothetical protein COW32_00165 [Candidatus Aquicultor secundus]PIX52048.1 MAG: hypothetical protein COZ51_06325 [Candidatus Aquicultor secundus]
MTATIREVNNNRGLRLVSGFLFTVFLIVALFAYHIYLLTSYDMIEKVGMATSREMVDVQSLSAIYYPELVKQAEKSPDADLVLPGLDVNLGIKARDIRNISKDRIGDVISRAIIKRIYYEGFSSVYKPATLSDSDQNGMNNLTGLADSFVNKDFNQRMLLVFYVSSALVALLAFPFFLFSVGFQKLTGFGVSLIVAGAPGLLLAFIRSRFEAMMQADRLGSGLVQHTLLPFIGSVQSTYLSVLLLGMGLFLVGISGIFISRGKA